MESQIPQLHRYSIDERGVSLSRHPHNMGYFTSVGLTKIEHQQINDWVDRQREYIRFQPLEVQAAITLWYRDSKLFDEPVDYETLVSRNDIDLVSLFDIAPTTTQIERYTSLLQNTILGAPALPFAVRSYIEVDNVKNYTELSFVKKSDSAIDYILTPSHYLLYLDVLLPADDRIMMPMGTQKNNPHIYDILPRNNALADDVVIFENAIKESIEEADIDPTQIGNIIGRIEVPYYKQKEYVVDDIYNTYMVNPTNHGLVGSGVLYTCPDDKTVLLFQRGHEGSSPGTWATIGGAVGETTVPIYKSRFFFDNYINSLTITEKRILMGHDKPRINYEHLGYRWISYDEVWPQLKNFNSVFKHDGKDDINYFMDSYAGQFPISSKTNPHISLLKQGKAGLYVLNGKHYQRVLSGTAYVLWKLFYKNFETDKE